MYRELCLTLAMRAEASQGRPLQALCFHTDLWAIQIFILQIQVYTVELSTQVSFTDLKERFVLTYEKSACRECCP